MLNSTRIKSKKLRNELPKFKKSQEREKSIWVEVTATNTEVISNVDNMTNMYEGRKKYTQIKYYGPCINIACLSPIKKEDIKKIISIMGLET